MIKDDPIFIWTGVAAQLVAWSKRKTDPQLVLFTFTWEALILSINSKNIECYPVAICMYQDHFK